MTVEAARII